MIKTGYLGKYQGVPIYTISFKEFYELSKAERDTTEVIYMIQEDRQVITGGKVFGNITVDGKRLNPYANKVEWRIPYATSITKIRKNEMKIQNEVEDAKIEMKIERPTTESLVKETEKKLVEVKHVAENKVEDLHHEAEAKLAEVVEESGDAVQMVLETATEAATDMAAESKKVLNAVAEEGTVKAEAVTAKSTATATTRRKKKTVTPAV